MTTLETIKGIIEHQKAEQKMREDSLKFKDREIKKFQNYIADIEERKKEIEKEIEENNISIEELSKIEKQLEEALCVGEQG